MMNYFLENGSIRTYKFEKNRQYLNYAGEDVSADCRDNLCARLMSLFDRYSENRRLVFLKIKKSAKIHRDTDVIIKALFC